MERYRSFSLAAVLLAVGLLALSATPARAQASGSTDVDITIPDIVILHYFSSVQVTITQGALGTFLTGTAGDQAIDEGTPTFTGAFDHDLAIGPSALSGGDPAAAVMILRNAWAVRSISLAGGTNTTLDIDITGGPVLSHSVTAASITISSAAVDDGTSNGPSITFAAPGLANPVVGDVNLTLDLTNAINAGDYLGGVYTLTATNV
jgi:hypothetical protein